MYQLQRPGKETFHDYIILALQAIPPCDIHSTCMAWVHVHGPVRHAHVWISLDLWPFTVGNPTSCETGKCPPDYQIRCSSVLAAPWGQSLHWPWGRSSVKNKDSSWQTHAYKTHICAHTNTHTYMCTHKHTYAHTS